MLRLFDYKNRGFCCWTHSFLLHFALTILTLRSAVGQQPLEVEFNLLNVPSCRQALVALSSPGFASFEKRPLGECLQALAEAYRVPMWVDRRVDLSRLVSIFGNGAKDPPESKTTLARLAAVAKLGGADVGLVENVVYVGPADQIGVVQRAAVRLHNEIMLHRKAAVKVAKVDSRTLSWEDITTPMELLERIEQQWSIKVDSKIPHDLMHAGQLPSTTLATQLTLLHAGFDLQVDCDTKGTFTVSPLIHESVWQAGYPEKELQSDRVPVARKEFPAATIQIKGGVSTVTGPTAFHLRLLAIRLPKTRPPSSRTGDDAFQIPEFRAPLERVIGDFAKKLGMEVQWSKDIPENKRKAVITFGVPKAKTIDEILKQIADENGLTIHRQGQLIEVFP